MSKITNSYSISLEILPWTDNGHFKINKLHLVEELGGRIPEGEIQMYYDEDQEANDILTKTQTGTIKITDEKEGGLSFEIPYFIVKRKIFKNIIFFNIICTQNIEFYNKPVAMTYKEGIKAAISNVFPGKLDIRIEPDSAVDGKTEYQRSETGYEFCKRLAYAYKKNSVFCFGWEGLMIKDTMGETNSEGKVEQDDTIIQVTGGKTFFNVESNELNYHEETNHEPYNPWKGITNDQETYFPTTQKSYEDVESKNATVVMNMGQYQIIGKDKEQHLDNSRFNERLMNSSYYSKLKIKAQDLPNFKIGDVVQYRRVDEDSKPVWKKFIVKGNELFWTGDDADGQTDELGFPFSWTTLLLGLDNGDWNKSPATPPEE